MVWAIVLRVKDPKKSLEYYKLLRLSEIEKKSFRTTSLTSTFSVSYSLVFIVLYSQPTIAYDGPESAQTGQHFSDREGVLELTHNYGTENDPNFSVHNGNKDPRGFGHICVSVDNIQAACQRIEDAGYKFQKKLTGKNRCHGDKDLADKN